MKRIFTKFALINAWAIYLYRRSTLVLQYEKLGPLSREQRHNLYSAGKDIFLLFIACNERSCLLIFVVDVAVARRFNAGVFMFSENVSILGSDDTTTCIIVVVRHSG